MVFIKIKRFIAFLLTLIFPMLSSCIDVSLMPKKGVVAKEEESKIVLSHDDVAIDLNATFQINIIDAEEINYYWYSGNSSIICALGEGKTCNVMGVGTGQTYVKVKDDIGRESFCQITVSNYSDIEVSDSSATIGNKDEDAEVKSISMGQKEITLSPTETATLSVVVSPAKAIQHNDLHIISTDTTVVDVFEGGIILAKNPGFATIEAICGGLSASCEVTVAALENDKVERIDGINPSLSFSGKKMQQFNYSIFPENLSNVDIEIINSNDEIIQVVLYKMLNKIVFTSLSPGNCIITLKCGNFVKNYVFDVKEEYLQDFSIKIGKTIVGESSYGNKEFTLHIFSFSFTLLPANAFGAEFYFKWSSKFPTEKDYYSGGFGDVDVAFDGTTEKFAWASVAKAKDKKKFTEAADKSTEVNFEGRVCYFQTKNNHRERIYPLPAFSKGIPIRWDNAEYKKGDYKLDNGTTISL